MTTFNGIDYVEQQISSILKQLPVNDELIISDDGSDDGTFEFISRLAIKDSRVKVLKGPRKGLIKNFEFALNASKGDYIFLSDQDDLWHESKITMMLSQLEKFDLVVSDCTVVDKEMSVIEDSFFCINRSGNGLVRNLVKNSFLGCCMAFNRKILDAALPFPEGLPMHDWWIGLISNVFGKSMLYEKKLVSYRRHGKNASATAEKSEFSLLHKLKMRVAISYWLTVRFMRKLNCCK